MEIPKQIDELITKEDIKKYIDDILFKMTDRKTYFTKSMTKGALRTIQESIDALPIIQPFYVIDTKTGKRPDEEKIALREKWAKGLIYCDMEGFFVGEDGQLILADECGHFTYCPPDRFKIKEIKNND